MPRLTLLLLTSLIRSATAQQIPPPADGAALYQNVCTACHGDQGQGNDDLRSPAIAAMPAWYTSHQLKNFRESIRGVSPQDAEGLAMAAVAKTLPPEHIEAVGRHVAALDLVTPAELTVDGADVEEGRYLFQERCMECHRYNASGEMAFGSPPLVGRQGWYLMAQLQKFQNGHRGAVEGDVNGAKMVFTSGFIEDEQDLKDVVAYILSLNPGSGSEDEKRFSEGH